MHQDHGERCYKYTWAMATGSSGYLGENSSTRHCPAPGTNTLKPHQSFLLSTKKPHKNQKSPTKSLKVMISKAISSQALNSRVLGNQQGVGRRQRRKRRKAEEEGRGGRLPLTWQHPSCHIPSSLHSQHGQPLTRK